MRKDGSELVDAGRPGFFDKLQKTLGICKKVTLVEVILRIVPHYRLGSCMHCICPNIMSG